MLLPYPQTTGAQWACKILRLPDNAKKVKEGQSTRAEIQREIDIMAALHHPNVSRLVSWLISTLPVYLLCVWER